MLHHAFWIAGEPLPADSYAGLRGRFQLKATTHLNLRLLGSSWYCVWLDGEYLVEGPHRFPPDHPEYQEVALTLPAGAHLIAIEVAWFGVSTRILQDIPPFMIATLVDDAGREYPVDWRGIELPGYLRTGRRLNGQLGWMEYQDKQQTLAGWKRPAFEDQAWPAVQPATPPIGAPQRTTIGEVRSFRQACKPIDSGLLAETFGYRMDDPPMQFYLRDLTGTSNPPQGFWRRYDLGRVRLAKPDFEIEAPAGATVQFAYSEYLLNERVTPWITLSSSQSCNMDGFVTRAGRQTLCPLQPKGGRFVEVHVLGAAPEQVKFLREEFIERGYHAAVEGAFECSDPLLNTIWSVGVETYRACTEDGVIDNPTRERGQWTGDVVTVGMDISSVAYADLRLIRRGLVQSAQCAREDGLVAGLCPGGVHYHPSYSAQWVNACLHYFELTGELNLLDQMWGYARANVAAFEAHRNEVGIGDAIGHIFIDWGYKRNAGPADIAFNMHFLATLRGMIQWSQLLNDPQAAEQYRARCEALRANLLALTPTAKAGHADWKAFGYHSTVLALANGLVESAAIPVAIAYLKAHMLECFPNDPSAPRNAGPEVSQPRLITPYFAHYAFPVMIEAGEIDFVLDQYRKCWGWALEGGRTTWVEVFDTRWTHCHQWAGCPTWQLSRYVLGLHARFDLDANTYKLDLRTGGLDWARGALPLRDGSGVIEIQWQLTGDGIDFEIKTPVPIQLDVAEAGRATRTTLRIEGETKLELDGAGLLRGAAEATAR